MGSAIYIDLASPLKVSVRWAFQLPISRLFDARAEYYVVEASPSPPDDNVARGRIVRSGEVAAEAGNFDDVT